MRPAVRACATAMALVALSLSGCRSDDDPVVADIVVYPSVSVFTEPMAIRVAQLDPDQLVTIELSSTDADGLTWSAEASFRADDQGVVDVAKQAPVSGDYDGKLPMGLLLSMEPAGGSVFYSWPESGQARFDVIASIDGEAVGSATLQRRLTGPGVTTSRVNPDSGLVGKFWRPASQADDPRPAMLVFGGSEGG